jgi:hypothetical protein
MSSKVDPLIIPNKDFDIHSFMNKFFYYILPSNVHTLEVLNMKDGTLNFTYALGSGCFYNPNYAGIQIGSNHEIVVGTVGGVLRISPSSSSSSMSQNDDLIKWLYPTTYIWLLNSHFSIPHAAVILISILFIELWLLKLFIFNFLPTLFQKQYENAVNKNLINSNKNDESLDQFQPMIRKVMTDGDDNDDDELIQKKSLPSVSDEDNDDEEDDEEDGEEDGDETSELSNQGGGLKALKERLREEQQARIHARVAARQSLSPDASNKRAVSGNKSPAKRSRHSVG